MLTSGVISRFVKSIHTRIGQSIGVNEARWARWWHLLVTALDWRVQEHVAGSTLRSAKAQRKEVKRGSQAETRPFIRTAGGRKLRCERAEHCRTRCGDCRSRNPQLGSSAPASSQAPDHFLALPILSATAQYIVNPLRHRPFVPATPAHSRYSLVGLRSRQACLSAAVLVGLSSFHKKNLIVARVHAPIPPTATYTLTLANGGSDCHSAIQSTTIVSVDSSVA